MTDFKNKYDQLLANYNEYRQKSLKEKEEQLRQYEKYKAHLDKLYKQMSKKYETAVEEERLSNQKKLNKIEAAYKNKLQQTDEIVRRKEMLCEELRQKLMQSDREKCEVIEESTRMLCEIAQGMEDAEQRNGPFQNSYHQLMRMYQFVVQENNSLKKQLYRVGKNGGGSPEPPNNKTIEVVPKKAYHSKHETSIESSVTKPPKKKKAVNSSADNSKLHNQAIRPKTGTQKRSQVGGRRASNLH